MYVGGILAGGIGSRMIGSSIPKQFLNIDKKPVLIWTLERFLKQNEIEIIIIAMNYDWIEYAKKIIEKHIEDKNRVKLINGGVSRFESLVKIAEEAINLSTDHNNPVYVVSHDCARPFVSNTILENNMREAEKYAMVTTSVPTIDTVLISEDGKVSTKVPNRDTVFLDQGPQTFSASEFLSLVEKTDYEERKKYMEAGRLYLDNGYSVGIVTGDRYNFKITTEFDLIIANELVKQKCIGD